MYDNPIPTRFLASLDCSKILAQAKQNTLPQRRHGLPRLSTEHDTSDLRDDGYLITVPTKKKENKPILFCPIRVPTETSTGR